MISLDEILTMIEKNSGMTREQVVKKVEEKYEELSGLITKEGAAYLVAREFGISLPPTVRRLEIKNIVPGARNLNIIGRIFQISRINEFSRSDGSKGRVVNLLVGDATGYIRLPLWNDQVSLVEEEMLKLGDVIQIVNGIARENIFGDVEISLGRYGSIRPVDLAGLPTVEELIKRFLTFTPERTKIRDIVPGKFEIKATIVQVFKGRYLFNVCPICGSTTDGNVCGEHGEIEPEQALVISVVLDDGTGSLRGVFFRQLAEKLINTSVNELKELSEEERYKLVSKKILGKEMYFVGRVRKNKRFGRLEMLVDSFKDLNVLEESKQLVDEIRKKVGVGA